MQYNQLDYENATLIFLLELHWLGQTHRFSTIPIVFDGYEYLGGLNEITFEESTDDIGIDTQANSAAIAVYFDGLNMVQEYRKGRTLEGERGILSYILMKNDQVYSTKAVLVLDGTIQQCIFGDPEEPESFVSFSLEEKEYDTETALIPPLAVIDENKWPYADDEAIGKKYPLVFGEPGATRKGSATQQLFCTPAYNYKKDNVGSPTHETRFVISHHACIGENVQITDNVTAPLTRQIQQAIDADGQKFCFIDVSFSSLLYPGATSLSNNAEHPNEFWVSWIDGGGLANPYGPGVLTGGGDLVRWILSRSNLRIDDAAFANIAPILNEYRFAGFVNEDMTTTQLLNDHILPYLPIQIKAGPKGLRPILHQYIALEKTESVTHIIADQGDWTQIGAIETATDTSEIFNAVRINYAWNGPDNSFFHSVYMGPDGIDTEYSKKNLYSLTSKNRYGTSQQNFDAMFIYDSRTAIRFCGDFIRRNSFPRRSIKFAAAIEYGFLQLGDVIEITSTRLFMDHQKCTVIGKTWDVMNWVFVLMFEDTPLHLDRTF